MQFNGKHFIWIHFEIPIHSARQNSTEICKKIRVKKSRPTAMARIVIMINGNEPVYDLISISERQCLLLPISKVLITQYGAR